MIASYSLELKDSILRSLLFWVVRQHRLVVHYQCSGSTCQSQVVRDCLGLTGSPKTSKMSVINYQSVLCNILPKKRRSHLCCGRSVQARTVSCWLVAALIRHISPISHWGTE